MFDYRPDGKFLRSFSQGRGGKFENIPEATYYLNDEQLSEALFATLQPRLADWLEVAHALYLADRLVLRGASPGNKSGTDWSRRIVVRIPVRECEFWRSVKSNLEEILSFLTQDLWRLDFTIGKHIRRGEMQNFLFSSVPNESVVMLESGGLDSFAGAVIHRARQPDKHLVLISAFTNSRIQSKQRKQARFIAEGSPTSVTHVAVGMGLRNWHKPKDLESTQRTRGFFHLSLGCIAAITLGRQELFVNENGIGALNLPFDRSQVGAQNSRPVNPITLAKMSSLAEKVSARRFSIINPFLWETKSEMCRQALSAKAMFKETMSCDHPQRLHGAWHCGICTSCLLRRLSLHSADIPAATDSTGYNEDLAKPYRFPQRSLQMLEKMEWQVSRLSECLSQEDPWSALTTEYPMLARAASILRRSSSNVDPEKKFISLLNNYTAEWRNFPLREKLSLQCLEAV